jgi:hypothetical protein
MTLGVEPPRLVPSARVQTCSVCGARSDEGGRFCPTCGGVLVDAVLVDGTAPPFGGAAGRGQAPTVDAAAQTAQLEASRPSRPMVAPTQKIPDGLPLPPRYVPPKQTAEISEPEGEPARTAAAVRDVDSAQSEPAASLLGASIGDFVIEGVIGGGSFGTVYRGVQRGLERPVAIKVPTYEIAADPVQAQRFAREARAAARVVHPGVVAIYAVGELTDGRPYLAMQLIDGVPLDQILAQGPLSIPRALRIARHIASALSETHAAGVVHRDLKPSNVMWRRDRNGDDRITLVDFGIAVCRPGHADAARLTSNGLIGTPHYMSPEQAHGDQVDARADLYALGCLLFELATGAPPFQGAGVEVLLAHLGKPPPYASERNPKVPMVVDRLIARLMHKAPDDRPASADEVVTLIDAALDELGGVSRARRRTGKSTGGVPRIANSASGLVPRSAGSTAGGSLDGAPALARTVAGSRRWPHRRWLVAGAIGGVLIVGGVVGVMALRHASGDDEASVSSGRLISKAGEPLQLISRDDGELIVRTELPEVVHVNQAMRAHIEIVTKLGGNFDAKQVVITLEDPHHNATALTAQLHDDRPGHYRFRHTFTEPGTYVVRIFPSETETVSTFELDVVP